MTTLDGNVDFACSFCGERAGFDEDGDSFYCRSCLNRTEHMNAIDTQPDDNLETNPHYHRSVHRLRANPKPVKSENFTVPSQGEPQNSSFWGFGEPRVPKEEEPLMANDLSSLIRSRYVMGVQFMMQAQCKVLVEEFGASPLIFGVAGVIWFRFVGVSRVFDDEWADQTFEDSEINYKGLSQERTTQSTFNMYGQSRVMIWFRSLRKKIPISSSLAVSFLACHIAREPILPTDIQTWALEAKLPYLTAFMEKFYGCLSSGCPLSSSIMFRPFKVIGSRQLESQSGFLAQSIGLQLPPVNFFAIARRYLKELSLPYEMILPYATRIYEWSMPPDLWVSANPKRLPTRVSVMSIIVLTIRLLYNINGFGKWEKSLSTRSTCTDVQVKDGDSEKSSPSYDRRTSKKNTRPAASKPNKRKNVSKQSSQLVDHNVEPEKIKDKSSSSNLHGVDFKTTKDNLGTTELLCSLEAMCEKTLDGNEYSKDLRTYLKFCNNVVFAGLKPLHDNSEEERIIQKLWNFYDPQEDSKADVECNTSPREKKSSNNGFFSSASTSGDRIRNVCHTPNASAHSGCSNTRIGCSHGGNSDTLEEPDDQISENTAVKVMKLNMEESGFCYIPPRVRVKRLDHLHYIRKNDEGTRCYVAHADYYILLRACALVAQVGARYMHSAVLKLEKRLSWIENHIDHSLDFICRNPPIDGVPPDDMEEDDPVDLLDFNPVI